MKTSDLDTFTRHYLAAALWSSIDDNQDPMDDNYSLSDFAPEALQRAFDDCQRFQMLAAVPLTEAYLSDSYQEKKHHPDAGSAEALAGHDFWLTRGGHGVGFWDRDLGDVGDVLTTFCKAPHFRNVDVYVGDDKQIYFA